MLLPTDYIAFSQALQASACAPESERDYADETQSEEMSRFYEEFNSLLSSTSWTNEELVAIMTDHIHEWVDCKLCSILDENLECLYERIFERFSETLTLSTLTFMLENLENSRSLEWPDTNNSRAKLFFGLHPVSTRDMLAQSAWHWAQCESWDVSEGNPTTRAEYLEILHAIKVHPEFDDDVLRTWLRVVHEELPNAEHLGCGYVEAQDCPNCHQILMELRSANH